MRACLKPLAGNVIFLLALAAAAPSAERNVAGRGSVKVIADQRLEVKTPAGNGVFPLYVSHDWTRRQSDVTRAVVVLHGALRNADDYLRSAQDALAAAGEAARATLLVVPQFITDRDVISHKLPDGILHWGSKEDSWIGGAPAHGPAAISSFDALDAILVRLADRMIFPNLARVVVAGHSAGAQLLQRYAVAGRAEAGLTRAGIGMRYIVANPSSYLYFSPDRPGPNGSFIPFNSVNCFAFNRWKYGWLGAPPYARKNTPADYERTYAARQVVYLLGTADTDPDDPALDRSCPAQAQGSNRYARGLAYARYIKVRHPHSNHRVLEAPGIGHDAEKILNSKCGLAALFDRRGCAER